MKSLAKLIFIGLLGLVNIQAQPRQLVSQQEQAQAVLRLLQANKIKFIAKPNTPQPEPIIGVYDRLIFALNSRYVAGDVVEFLAEYCLTLAENEQLYKRPLVQFYAHLSDVIRNTKNERENVALAIENYLHAAPVTAPMTAARFIMNNSYTDGQQGQRAAGLNREDAGPSTKELANEGKQVSDFEFSGEIENWFAQSMTESTAPQTSEQDSRQTPPSEPSTPTLDSSAPNDKPAANSATTPPLPEHSQSTTASASEPTLETK